ncbi:outer membrane beta-barrel protein [Aurantibacter crassamenti]|uniref:outer membrane beta-barrel protein n=1 Tax=Aurantibacter crassamenti TaxID=1837375 RepID=UPI001EEEAB23|nr:outer membrane beta-barrel protein [Aurantibacter crassamenti]
MKVLRTTLLVAVFACISTTAFAQSGSGFGITGGLNYGANGNYFESVGAAAKNPDRNIGYHVGFFGKIGNRFFFRPEVVYTKTQSDYAGDKLDISRLDAPMLVGVKVIGPLNVFAGPAFQYILDSEFEGIGINEIENDFSVGLHIGAGVNLGKIGFDLRYERGFSENEAKFINTNITTLPNSRVDTRPDQLILSASIKF